MPATLLAQSPDSNRAGKPQIKKTPVAASSKLYTAVRLGSFKTLSGMRTMFNHLNPEQQAKTLVCHNGAYYTLISRAPGGKEQANKLVEQVKSVSPDAMLIKTDFNNCIPAQSFFAATAPRHLPKSPPVVQKESHKKAPSAPHRSPSHQPVVHEKPHCVQEAAQVRAAGHETKKKEKAPYADLRKPSIRKYLQNGPISVSPETPAKVLLSNRDVNRIICMDGPIKDVVFSQEKGINIKISGSNAFVKFLITRDPLTGNPVYTRIPSELYVVCGDNTVYTMIALPRDIPAQELELHSAKPKIKKNLSLFEGVPFERKVLMLVKDAYLDQIPDSFTVKPQNRTLNIFRNINVLLRRAVIAEGEGLSLKEYVLTLKPQSERTEMRLKEQYFLLPELAQNPVGISLEHMILRKGTPVRLFIVERHQEG